MISKRGLLSALQLSGLLPAPTPVVLQLEADAVALVERPHAGCLDCRGVDGPGIARIRSKGDKVLFGGRDTKTMKEIWGVPASRPLADFAPEVVVIAKQLAAAITTHNVKTNDLYGEPAITEEHVENNRTVYQGLKSRGVQPQHLEPEEDIQKVARRHAADAKQLAKTEKKKKDS